jgi:hypothetical protein
MSPWRIPEDKDPARRRWVLPQVMPPRLACEHMFVNVLQSVCAGQMDIMQLIVNFTLNELSARARLVSRKTSQTSIRCDR